MSANVIARIKSRRVAPVKPAIEVGSSMLGIGTPINLRNTIRTRTYASEKSKNLVFCVNQLGGVGRYKSQFSVSSDGINCKSRN